MFSIKKNLAIKYNVAKRTLVEGAKLLVAKHALKGLEDLEYIGHMPASYVDQSKTMALFTNINKNHAEMNTTYCVIIILPIDRRATT